MNFPPAVDAFFAHLPTPSMSLTRIPLIAGAVSFVAAISAASNALAEVDYAATIAPLLTEHCYACHGPDAQEAGLRFDQRDAALAELDSGAAAIVPGDPEASELLFRVSDEAGEARMPPEGPPLAQGEIEALREWIADGARFETHWAYRPLVRPAAPGVLNETWPRSDLDRFVLARLEAAGVEPSPEADPYTLIKRLYYDLIGLPPEPAVVDALTEHWSDDAYAELVDRLLASEHFGERWGRHWLDMARYADSDGYEKDNPRPEAWRYRDWVIDAVNDDLPYDRFVTEQLAGDLLPDASHDQVLATAFHRQTLTNTEGGVDQEEFRVEAVMDRVETFGAVWLGLTVGCARCHNHKFDAISQDEFYGLFAFFNNADETTARIGFTPTEQEEYETLRAAQEERVAELESQIAAAEEEGAKKLKEQLDALKQETPRRPGVVVRVVSERPGDDRRITRLLRRGDFLQPQHETPPGVLAVTPSLPPTESGAPPNRLDLARWLFDESNPLPPRVAVNQVWSRLFGEGLVRTMNDFGVRGESPTHPRLLDWLAVEFRSLGWSRKELIRTIVLSAAYRQSSAHRPSLATIDPENRLLHRQNRFRVEAEVIRDAALAASGLLCRTIGGPSVFPPLPPSIAELTYNSSFQWRTSRGDDRYRRGMYTYFKRTAPHPNLTIFDCPDSVKTAVRRQRSNTPIGALVTLNNEVFVEAAQAFAENLLDETPEATDEQRLARAFRACLVRPPHDEEVARLQELLAQSRAWYAEHPREAAELAGTVAEDDSGEDDDADPGVDSMERVDLDEESLVERAAYTAVLRVVLNLDEFLTRE